MPEWNKIFFLHIPKTAGSAFNRAFMPCVPNGRYFDHMESRRGQIDSVVNDGLPFFLSGHMPFETMNAVVNRRDIFSVTILRDPTEQLISHLNWVKYVGSPQFPNPADISESIMNLAKPLYETPLSKIDKIASLIDTAIGHQLFDNLQIRYLTNTKMKRITQEHCKESLVNIQKFNFFFVLSDMDRAIFSLRQQIPLLGDVERFNEARINDNFDAESDSAREFVDHWTKHDRVLYETARSLSLSQHLGLTR